jgi:hypothetical protein
MNDTGKSDAKVRGRSGDRYARDGRRIPEGDWFASRYKPEHRHGRDPLVVRATHSGLIAACRRVGLADTNAEIRAALEHLRGILAQPGGAP